MEQTCVRRLSGFVGVGMSRGAKAACVIGLLSGAMWGTTCVAQPLNSAIERTIAKAKVGSSVTSVYAVDLATGLPLASIRSDEAMTPASNQKLLTTGTALLVLGSDFVFKTELILDGTTLVVRGAGDPALGDPELLSKRDKPLAVDEVLDFMAGAVAKAGITKLDRIVIDDRVFDRQMVHASWPSDQYERTYCAQVSGLNFRANTLAIFVRPGSGDGAVPYHTTEPAAAWIDIDKRNIRTVTDGKNIISLTRPPSSNRFILRGEVRSATQAPIEITIDQPGLFCGTVLADRLLKAGVAVGDRPAGDPRQYQEPSNAVVMIDPAAQPTQGRVIAQVTTPLMDVISRCNVDSQNLYADCLFKLSGQKITGEPGSWDSGASVVRMMLSEKLGPQAVTGAAIIDGSGLSRLNTVTTRSLASWLAALAKDPRAGDTFVDTLPTPGEGTLEKRFRGRKPQAEIRGKSGFINGVRSLSGYLTAKDSGHRIAYSILMNSVPGQFGGEAKDLHEDIVSILDQWLAKQDDDRARVGG